jgi:hypothetical protein
MCDRAWLNPGMKMPSLPATLVAFARVRKHMKLAWLVIAVAAVTAATPASARTKHPRHHPVARQCVDRPYEFSWLGVLTNPKPEPNGCAPPVYQYGRYIGQDPDPNIRFQLRRDPATGYSGDLY